MATRAKTWGDFKRWCDARNLKALPAHPWTIAAYLRWLERRKRSDAVGAAVDIIAREHLLKSARVPTRHPTVQRTMEVIARRAGTAAQRSSLFDDDPFAPAPKKARAKRSVTDSQNSKTPRRWSPSTTPRLKTHRPKKSGG